MRKNKLFTAVICLLMTVMFLSVPASAADEVSAKLPFSVRNASGTVVMEALDEAPLPDETVYEDVMSGVFTIHFSEADTYHYKVYQRPGDEGDAIYDDTVYEVAVTVLFDEKGKLSTALSVNKEGNTHKVSADGIVFKNTAAEGGISLHKTVTGSGDKSREWHFTVTLGEALTGSYGDIAFQDGVGHVTLKHGETAVANGLLPGISYRVTEEEANQDGYSTTSEGAAGKTVNGTILYVSFENHKSIISTIIPAPKTGDYTPIGLLTAAFVISQICIILILFIHVRRKWAGGKKYEGKSK